LITSTPPAGIGWQAGRNGVMAPRDAGKLSFSFDAEGGGGNATLQRDTSQTVRFSDVRCLRLFTLAVTNARAANHKLYDTVWDRHSLRSTRLPFSCAYVTKRRCRAVHQIAACRHNLLFLWRTRMTCCSLMKALYGPSNMPPVFANCRI